VIPRVSHLIGNRASFLCTKAPVPRVPETNFLQGITSIIRRDVGQGSQVRRPQGGVGRSIAPDAKGVEAGEAAGRPRAKITTGA